MCTGYSGYLLVRLGDVARLGRAFFPIMSEKDKCGTCRIIVEEEDEEALCCDGCEVWYHRNCLQINKTTYKKLKSQDPWLCKQCEQTKNKAGKGKKKTYTIDDVMEKLNLMQDNYDNLIQKYEEQVAINNELRKELHEIKNQLNNNEQKCLNNNIIVQGIPAKEKENIQVIVEKMAKALKVPNKVQAAYRLGNAGTGRRSAPIRIIFENGEDKKQWMSAKRDVGLTTQILEGNSDPETIYINHDLTKHNLQLFKLAKQYKKENNYKYVWISDGKILIRKTDSSRPITIKNIEDLKN